MDGHYQLQLADPKERSVAILMTELMSNGEGHWVRAKLDKDPLPDVPADWPKNMPAAGTLDVTWQVRRSSGVLRERGFPRTPTF